MDRGGDGCGHSHKSMPIHLDTGLLYSSASALISPCNMRSAGLTEKAAMQLRCRLDDLFDCRWDKYLPYRSKEASGRAAEASAKQEIKQKAETGFVEKPMMPLALRTEAEAVGGSQSARNFSRSQWESDTIQELRALELGARLRQERAVIGESHHKEVQSPMPQSTGRIVSSPYGVLQILRHYRLASSWKLCLCCMALCMWSNVKVKDLRRSDYGSYVHRCPSLADVHIHSRKFGVYLWQVKHLVPTRPVSRARCAREYFQWLAVDTHHPNCPRVACG